MEAQEYLNQISSEARPEKKSKIKNIMSLTITKIALVALGVLVVLLAVTAIFSGRGDSLKKRTTALLLHIDSTSETISQYQSSVKSSQLRSYSALLNSTLSNTSRQLTDYMAEKFSYKSGSADEALREEARLHNDDLVAALFNAKINGTLDRIYAHKMAYEISLLQTEATGIYETTSDDTLKSIMATALSSLNNLYDEFDNFSETK